MPVDGFPEQPLDRARRRGYLFLCLCGTAVFLVISVLEWRVGNWHPLVGLALTGSLLGAVLNPRVSTQRMDELLGWAADAGALFTLWSISRNPGPFSAMAMLIFSFYFVMWFGVMPLRQAALRTALLVGSVAVIGALRTPPEPEPVVLFLLLAFLHGQMTYAGRRVRQESSKKDHFANLAMTDPLTGLLNRRALYQAIHPLYAPSVKVAVSRRAGSGMGILLMDLDHFKDINDAYGHDIGDRVLQHVAGVLRSCTGPGDRVARWGGEEFLMLVAADDRHLLEQRAERIFDLLRRIHSGLPPVTLSIGIAHGLEASDVDGLLRLADRRMYRAKRSGRDRMNKDTLLNLPETPGLHQD